LKICPRCNQNECAKNKTGKKAGKYKGYCNKCANAMKQMWLNESPLRREKKRQCELGHYYRKNPDSVPFIERGDDPIIIMQKKALLEVGRLVREGHIEPFGIEI